MDIEPKREELEVLVEIRNYSDRAIAVIGGQIVDNRLTSSLKANMRDSPQPFKRLFNPSGALGAFTTKIRLAYLLRIIDEQLYKDLLLIKDIRNEFAHEISTHAFKEEKIATWIKSHSAYAKWKEWDRKHKTDPELMGLTKILLEGMPPEREAFIFYIHQHLIDFIGVEFRQSALNKALVTLWEHNDDQT